MVRIATGIRITARQQRWTLLGNFQRKSLYMTFEGSEITGIYERKYVHPSPAVGYLDAEE